MANTKKKTAREKRVLVASLLVAAVMVGGSTFAWFTSQDEVTNRLSAKAEYNVTIAETFTPPEEWVPGQEVNKDVFAVNTGNVDALVKQSISGKITVTNETAGDDLKTAAAVPTTAVKLGTQYSSSTDSTTGAVTYSADEVTAIMAGSVLAYTNNDTDVAKVGRLTINVDGTTKTTTVPSLTQVPASEIATAAGVSAEGDLFAPAGAGLYIFRRSITKDESAAENTTETYTYSGYYFNGTDYYKVSLNDVTLNTLADQGYNGVLTKALKKTTTTDANNQTTEVYAVDNTKTDSVKEAANWIVESTVVATPTLTYEAESTTTGSKHPARLVATYDGTITTGTDAANDDIVIYINLNNIDNTGAAADKWQMLPTTIAGNTAVFYYTNDLEAGHTSSQLVDSIVMSKDTKNEAYKHFDFDLNVALDSVQIVKASDGTELVPGASAPNTATAVNDLGATATATNTGAEITLVTWSATT